MPALRTMRPLLAIETSGQSLGVALRAESGLIFDENVTAGSIHGKALAPLIQKAFAAAGLRPAELEAVAVSLGPGSWTGLRIGLSAAKALAWGANVKLAGVPSFEALALEAARHAPGHARLLVRDARSEGLFFALFNETLDSPQRWILDSVLKVPELVAAVDQVMALQKVPLAVCGDRACQLALREIAQQRGWTLLAACEYISAAAVAECGWQRLNRQGSGIRDQGSGTEVLATAAEIHKLAPLYLRASDPELKLERKA